MLFSSSLGKTRSASLALRDRDIMPIKNIELALFGSVLRDDFHADSDIDVMVQFDSNAHPTFLSLEQMVIVNKSDFF